MQIPAAEFIEAAQDMLPELDPSVRKDQRRELHVAIGEEPEDFVRGYELGIQTARVLLMANPKAVAAGVDREI
jgi:hypothetical protein